MRLQQYNITRVHDRARRSAAKEFLASQNREYFRRDEAASPPFTATKLHSKEVSRLFPFAVLPARFLAVSADAASITARRRPGPSPRSAAAVAPALFARVILPPKKPPSPPFRRCTLRISMPASACHFASTVVDYFITEMAAAARWAIRCRRPRAAPCLILPMPRL